MVDKNTSHRPNYVKIMFYEKKAVNVILRL